MKNFLHIPLVRQLLGAVVGATLALLLYQGYQAIVPSVTALLKIPSGSTDARFAEVNEVTANQVKFQRQEARNRTVAEHFAAPETFDRITARAKNIQLNLTDEQKRRAEEALDQPTVPDQMVQLDGAQLEPAQEPSASGDTVVAMREAVKQTDELPPAPSVLAASVGGNQERAQAAGEELPASGVGLWVGIVAAFVLTAAMRWRILKKAIVCRVEIS
ncbi:TPA: hypothetical protein DCL30_00315 [Candidatus Peribacteria bacterium]|nr:MAG: hypothetical protein A3J91_03865 [Candidatus Peribacteria bacterium RIFOXYC2_FULL_58_10]OGJ84408.1 MAG: hypothetical protein A2529_03390 [Candidatus Peribacteria bacterium RIFOXYD2_FULL_58_15]HAI97973.1 hypothetical protein [Candidatus Peribacteria bacterium]HAS34661.1 hypothetical protein [Candidatus Peribacteria bacterium]